MGRASDLVISETPATAPAFSACGSKTPQAKIARIFLMQNHPLMILGTSSFLDQQTAFSVAESATTPAIALDRLKSAGADAVIYELSMIGPFNFGFLETLRAEFPRLPILVLSTHEEIILARKTLDLGANGYLMKEAPPDDLEKALHHILEGGTYLSRRVQNRITRETWAKFGDTTELLNGARINSLSVQDLQILHLLGERFSLEEIEKETQFSRAELFQACRNIQEKLGLETWNDLIDFASHWVYHEGDFA